MYLLSTFSATERTTAQDANSEMLETKTVGAHILVSAYSFDSSNSVFLQFAQTCIRCRNLQNGRRHTTPSDALSDDQPRTELQSLGRGYGYGPDGWLLVWAPDFRLSFDTQSCMWDLTKHFQIHTLHATVLTRFVTHVSYELSFVFACPEKTLQQCLILRITRSQKPSSLHRLNRFLCTSFDGTSIRRQFPRGAGSLDEAQTKICQATLLAHSSGIAPTTLRQLSGTQLG